MNAVSWANDQRPWMCMRCDKRSQCRRNAKRRRRKCENAWTDSEGDYPFGAGQKRAFDGEADLEMGASSTPAK